MATWPDRRSNNELTDISPLELERDRVIARLRTECTEGRISLDRFSDLVGDAYAARTRGDLEPIAAALAPVPARVTRRDETSVTKRGASHRWMISVFGTSVRQGRHRMEDGTTVAAVFGDCVVDLTGATFEQQEISLNAFSVFGTVTVIVPPGVRVMMEGVSIFGTRRCDIDEDDITPADPVVVLRAVACFGDVRVRPPRRGRSGSRRGW